MTTKHSTKRALIASVLILALCFTSLIGTTFAWFTDTVTSNGNIIQSGTLDVEMYWADGAKDVPANMADWNDASKGAIFTHNLWEPGYTDAKHIMIANLGTLALKYELAIIPNGEVSELADVIDVYYYADGAEKIDGRDDLDGTKMIGTLADLIKTGIRADHLEAKTSHTVTLVLKMQETAGNEYMDMSVSGGFSVRLLATQYTSENDSFGNDYDENAWVDGFRVETASALTAALYNGGNVKMGADIAVDEAIVIPEGVTAVLDLNGFTLTADGSTYAISNLGNLTIVDSKAAGGYSRRALAVGNAVNARGIYNGYLDGTIVPTAKLTILNGNFNAIGTNGGAALFNYGTAEIKGGNFTSAYGYTLNNQKGASMTVEAGVSANNGIYNTGASLVVNGGRFENSIGGRHVVYSWNSNVTLNGGDFYNHNSGNATVMADGSSEVVINGGSYGLNIVNASSSYLLDANGTTTYEINGGEFVGGIRVQANAALTVKGGEFDNPYGNYNIFGKADVEGGVFKSTYAQSFAKNNLADGCSTVVADGGSVAVVEGTLTPALGATDGIYTDEDGVYYISNDEGLYAFAAEVNKYSNYERPFEGETVVLVADIDLDGGEWTPIGDYRFSANRFCGTFDGQGHTVSNFKISKTTDKNDSKKSSYGFFGNMEGTVKNLTIRDANVKSYAYVGALIGRVNGGSIINCHVVDCTVECTYWQVGGMFGQLNGAAVVEGCTVTGTTVTGRSAVAGLAGTVTVDNDNSSPQTDEAMYITDCYVGDSVIVMVSPFGGSYDTYVAALFGYVDAADEDVCYITDCTADGNTVKGAADNTLSYSYDGEIYVDGTLVVYAANADELKAALAKGANVIIYLTADITDTTVKLPAALENVTITSLNGSGFVNSTLMASDGNQFSYVGVTLDSLSFENSRISVTGWRNGGAVVTDFTVTGCTFTNLYDTTNSAPVHFNMAAHEAIRNFTFTNNVIDGATGGQKSGIYAQVTGKTTVTGNVINNVSFRPYVIQLTVNDGIDDEFTVTGNVFSGSAAGRAQGLANDATGEDNVKLIVSENIFKGITNSQQICYWNFNADKTTVDLSGNYFDIDIEANPAKIYYNSASASVADFIAKGLTSYYTELNADGTINTESLVVLG